MRSPSGSFNNGSGRRDGGRRAADGWLLFTKFLQQGPMVGSVVPSSRWMARQMVRGIDFDKGGCVVELGAGTGPITAELLRRADGRWHTLIVERDPHLYARLRERFPQADIAQADARNLEDLLAERRIDRVRHILCSLSLPWFTPPDRHQILDAARRRLTPDGTFRQLTYIPWAHLSMYRRYFHQVGFHFVFRNLPPGGVYMCREPK